MGTSLLLSVGMMLNNVLAPAQFCEGIRFDKMTYSQYLQEYALNIDVARGIKEQAEAKALENGATPEAALSVGELVRANAKYAEYVFQSTFVRKGQVSLCGKESGNW